MGGRRRRKEGLEGEIEGERRKRGRGEEGTFVSRILREKGRSFASVFLFFSASF